MVIGRQANWKDGGLRIDKSRGPDVGHVSAQMSRLMVTPRGTEQEGRRAYWVHFNSQLKQPLGISHFIYKLRKD